LLEPIGRSICLLLVSAASGTLVESAAVAATMEKPVTDGQLFRQINSFAVAAHGSAPQRLAELSARMWGMTTFPESHHDLLDADLAALATIARSGIPQQTAVWFLHEGGMLKLSLNTSRLKTKNLMKRPQCSLLVLDPAVPQRYLEVRGTAEIESDDDYAFARKVGAKYGGADLSEHDGPGESRVIVTIQPTNVYAVDMRIGQM
jgi:PPOX class probable F420-dependent enzyme